MGILELAWAAAELALVLADRKLQLENECVYVDGKMRTVDADADVKN